MTQHLNGNSKINKFSLFRHSCMALIFFILFYTLWFSPSLLTGQLLAPQDGFLQSIPAYYSPRSLWTTQLLGGFPIAADVTPQTWYPLAMLISLIPHSWNIFVISSYVLASSFTYGYIYLITQSVPAGLISGLSYGASGFMMARLGHTSIIHTATWIPCILLCCEHFIRSQQRVWFVFLSLGIACLFLAGHPQISIYGLVLVILYALFLGRLSVNSYRFYIFFSLSVVLGISLAAIQLIPTTELAQLTPRSTMSFENFVSYSVPLSHVVMAFFPYVLGGGSIFPYNLPPIGLFPPGDIPIYLGILPLILAAIGVSTTIYSKYFRYFWIIVAILSFLLVLGPATPLAWITYQIPIYNKFRILSRHSVELTIAVSILAGLGISAIERRQINEASLKRITHFSSWIIGVMALLSIGTWYYFWRESNISKLPLMGATLLFPSLLIQLGIFGLGIKGLNLYSSPINQHRPNFRLIILLALLIVDLGAFGWFCNWQASPLASQILTIPPVLHRYQSYLEQNKQRIFPLRGSSGSYEEVIPNLSRLWDAPNMSGYGPFLISRVGEFMSSNPEGSLTSSSLLRDNKDLSFDLTSVRYITTTAKPELPTLIPNNELKWSRENLSTSLGSVCLDTPVQSVDINLPESLVIDSIGFVGALGCSPSTVQGSNILDVEVIDSDGKGMSYNLRAGKDLSELLIECPQVASQMKHQIATVFQKTPIVGQNCPANSYVSSISLQKPSKIRQLKLRNPKDNNSVVHLNKISFNNSITGASYPFIGSRWKYVEDLGDVRVYENLNVMPRAWLVSQVQTVQPSQILNAVKTSQLPNGEVFNPRATALIEEPINFSSSPPDPKATVQVEFPTETQVRVTTHSTQPSFLVLSDVFYPGWEAHIDEKPAHIFQTDYILRGLNLPSGDHTISFSFRPKSFAIGCGISGASLALLLYLVITDRQNGKTASTPISQIHHESV